MPCLPVAQPNHGMQGCLARVPPPPPPPQQVLMLDGDSALLQDPAPLFKHPTFRRHGVMAWPDNLCERVMLYRRVDEGAG